MHYNDVKKNSDAMKVPDRPYSYWYNGELNTIIMGCPWDELRVFKAHEKDGQNYWRYDARCRDCAVKIGIERKTRFCLHRNISPDGRHILVCKNGLKIYKFIYRKNDGEEEADIEPTEWIIPFSTKEYNTQELAQRVKFE